MAKRHSVSESVTTPVVVEPIKQMEPPKPMESLAEVQKPVLDVAKAIAGDDLSESDIRLWCTKTECLRLMECLQHAPTRHECDKRLYRAIQSSILRWENMKGGR